MESVLTFIKVTIEFLFNLLSDAVIGTYHFFHTHWAQITSFGHYLWFNINLFCHWIMIHLSAIKVG